jgi:hypothetical protein
MIVVFAGVRLPNCVDTNSMIFPVLIRCPTIFATVARDTGRIDLAAETGTLSLSQIW